MEKRATGLTISAAALALALSGSVLAATQNQEMQGGANTGAATAPSTEPGTGAATNDMNTGATSAIGTADTQQAPDMTSSIEASKLMDKEVRNKDDQQVGSIKNLVIDPSGRITHAVVAQGGVLGVGQQLYAVPWDQIQMTPNQNYVTLNTTGKLADQFSRFNPDAVSNNGAVNSGAMQHPGTEQGQQ